MFDLGFSEILLVGIVALVVFGPEELPRLARTAGLLLGRLRRYVSDVKSDINRELEASDMKSMVGDLQDSARSLQDSLNTQARSFQAELSGGLAELDRAVHAPTEVLPLDSVPDPASRNEQVNVAPDLFAPAEPELQPESDLNQLDLFGQPVTPVPVGKD